MFKRNKLYHAERMNYPFSPNTLEIYKGNDKGNDHFLESPNSEG